MKINGKDYQFIKGGAGFYEELAKDYPLKNALEFNNRDVNFRQYRRSKVINWRSLSLTFEINASSIDELKQNLNLFYAELYKCRVELEGKVLTYRSCSNLDYKRTFATITINFTEDIITEKTRILGDYSDDYSNDYNN